MSTTTPPPPPPPSGAGDVSCFFGFLLSALTFGALSMLYGQLIQVLLLHPYRNRTFWAIIVYSFAMVPFAFASFVGQTSSQMITVIHGRDFLLSQPTSPWCNTLSQISQVFIPSLADLLLFYRLKVLWNRQWKILIPCLGLLYLLRLGLSIPNLVLSMKPPGENMKAANMIRIALSAAYFALNATFTGLVCYRLLSLRQKAERVLGRLQATLYNSYTTIFVESGGLVTLWAATFLICNAVGKFGEAFWEPSSYIIILARMLIVLRIPHNRAWTAEIVKASEEGVLDWEASSAQSVELSSVQSLRDDTLKAI